MSAPAKLCSGCEKPPPAEFCWFGRAIGCPSGVPPRDVDLRVWEALQALDTRVGILERQAGQVGR